MSDKRARYQGEIIRLADEEGLSVRDIADRLYERFGERISKSSVHRWLKERRPETKTVERSQPLTPELVEAAASRLKETVAGSSLDGSAMPFAERLLQAIDLLLDQGDGDGLLPDKTNAVLGAGELALAGLDRLATSYINERTS